MADQPEELSDADQKKFSEYLNRTAKCDACGTEGRLVVLKHLVSIPIASQSQTFRPLIFAVCSHCGKAASFFRTILEKSYVK